MASRETENNAYAKFWADKQRALWYVMVFSGVVNLSVPFRQPIQPRKGWPRPLLFSNSGVGSFTSHKNQMSLSEKTRKSNRLQMSLERQHFLLSYF